MNDDFDQTGGNMSDLRNQNIQINTEKTGQTAQVQNVPTLSKAIENQENKLGEKAVQSATEQFTKSWIEKYLCCLDFLKQYFQITSKDFYFRFLYSLIPFNHKFQEKTESSPDLYGPFWLYTTLILAIASCGSMTRFLDGNSTKNFFQEFVPIATGLIYGIGFGLPILLALLMKAFGTEITIVSVICTYGYSFSVFIPAAIICVIPNNIVQWVILAYATFSSTSLLVVSYWKELGKYVDKKRYVIIGIVLIFQVGLFLLFKLYFFHRFKQEITGEDEQTQPPSNSDSN